MERKLCIIRDDRYLEHKPGLVHPEHPLRLEAVHRMLDRDFPGRVIAVRPEAATMDQLEMVHTPTYIKKVLRTADLDFTHLAPDTPAGPKTYLAAWLAVGGCLKALELLMTGECETAFALVRPPGHHALPDRAAGFCIFNNLAVTARQALNRFGLERILIVDWDVHHGNGIQHIFYGEREVLYFSTHYLSTFPQTGDWKETGAGAGLGYTVNIPLPKDTDDDDILHCYRDVLGPVFRRYEPQLVLVAAGFDAHRDDPLGRLALTAKSFGWLTRLVRGLADAAGRPPVLFALEGGYDLKGLADSVHEVIGALLDLEPQAALPHPDTERGAALVARARLTHGPYGVWVDAPPSLLNQARMNS